MPEVVDISTAGFRPWILRFANRALPRAKPLRADQILDAAFRKAGHNDLGPDWDPEALQVLVSSINATAALSPLGAMIVRRRLEGAVVTRLRAQAMFERHPEILQQEVAPIWLITGMQRTGTTYLQRLLSADPGARALLSWETLDPVPRHNRLETAKRIRNARLSERALAWMSPGFFAIHPIEHRGPEEDVLLLDPTFYSSAPEAIMQVPEFGFWLETRDHTLAYRWEEKMLKLLQWQRPATRWILKSPHHLEHLSAFEEVFPQTRFIWAHRDPLECLPSFLSMVYHGRAMFSDRADVAQVREHWLRKLRVMLDKAMEFRHTYPGAIVDVQFENLVRRPTDVLEDIYSVCEEPLTEATREAFRGVIDGHRRHRFGVHKYSATDFGIDQAALRETFADYYQLLEP